MFISSKYDRGEKEEKSEKKPQFNTKTFNTIYNNSIKDPLLIENTAEAIALALIVKDIEIVEEPEIEYVEINGEIVKRNVVQIAERPVLDANNNFMFDDMGEIIKQNVNVVKMKKIVKNITLNPNVNFEEAKSILKPMTTGKIKNSYIMGMSKLEAIKLSNLHQQDMLVTKTFLEMKQKKLEDKENEESKKLFEVKIIESL